MDAARNPYAPGAGRPPTALVGRDRELKSWRVALDRIEHNLSVQPVALYGLRGVGKTVLLTRMAQLAEERDWLVAPLEAGAGAGKTLREGLGEAPFAPLSDLARPSAGKRLRRALKMALSFKASYDSTGSWHFGLDLSESVGGGADSGVLESDLGKLVRDLSSAAQEEGFGFALLIDEAQDLSREELVALCAIAHQASQRGWPLLLAMAGLPSLPRDVTEAKSYAERLFVFFHITALPAQQAMDAVALPARAMGVTWAAAALSRVVERAGGYPYFLQQYGQDTWNVAQDSMIDLSDALLGIAAGDHVLDTGFFRARWDRATKAEQDYLRAMAPDGDLGSQSGELAARLGKRRNSLGPVRSNLIAKGLIYAPEHGRVAFTEPGMAAFIARQPTA